MRWLAAVPSELPPFELPLFELPPLELPLLWQILCQKSNAIALTAGNLQSQPFVVRSTAFRRKSRG